MAYIRIVFCPISLKIFPLYGFTSKLVTFVRHCYFLFVPFSITTLLFSFSNSRKLTQIVHKLFIFLMTVPFFLAFSYVPNDWSIIGRSFVSIFFSSVLTGCSKSCSKLLSCRGTCRQEDYTTLSGCRAASEGFLYPSDCTLTAWRVSATSVCSFFLSRQLEVSFVGPLFLTRLFQQKQLEEACTVIVAVFHICLRQPFTILFIILMHLSGRHSLLIYKHRNNLISLMEQYEWG